MGSCSHHPCLGRAMTQGMRACFTLWLPSIQTSFCLPNISPPLLRMALHSDSISTVFIHLPSLPQLCTKSAHCRPLSQCLAQEGQDRQGHSILAGSSWNRGIRTGKTASCSFCCQSPVDCQAEPQTQTSCLQIWVEIVEYKGHIETLFHRWGG